MVVILWIAVVIASCASPDEADTPTGPGPEVVERRLEYRTALRAELGAEYDRPLGEPTPSQLEYGQRTYEMLCSACHGRVGRGNGRSSRLLGDWVPDMTDPATADFYSDRAKLQIIRKGVPGTTMIGWEQMLTAPQQLEVLHYVGSLITAPRESGAQETAP